MRRGRPRTWLAGQPRRFGISAAEKRYPGKSSNLVPRIGEDALSLLDDDASIFAERYILTELRQCSRFAARAVRRRLPFAYPTWAHGLHRRRSPLHRGTETLWPRGPPAT